MYERLGVGPRATDAEIRSAYRRLARLLHPDRGAAGSEAAMAAINEAWRVLSDPGRRALYDASLREPAVAAGAGRPVSSSGVPDADDAADEAPDEDGARSFLVVALPWILVLAVLGGIFLFTAYARGGLGGGSGTSVPADEVDGVVEVGSCVALDGQARAVEASCRGPHLGVTRQIVAPQAACPPGTEGFYSPDSVRLICISRD